MVRSRSGKKRVFALVAAGVVAISPSLGGVHDPSCRHHFGEGSDLHWLALDLQATAAAHHGEHLPGQQTPPEDCDCAGGLCVLATAHHEPAATRTVFVELPSNVTVVESDIDEWNGPHTDSPHFLPPATGPPTTV